MSSSPLALHLATRVYRVSLALYPRSHAGRFGDEMVQVFGDLCREVYRRDGLAALILLWLAALVDLMKTALEVRFQELTLMTREHWTRLAGLAFMIGPVAMLAGGYIGSFETMTWDELGGLDGFYEYGSMAGFVIATLMFTIGMFGLRGQYASRAGRVGATALLVGGIAGIVSLVGGIAMAAAVGDYGWAVWSTGLATLFIGLFVFGVAAWRSRLMGRWRLLPIVAGLGFPLVMLFGIGYQKFTGEWVEPSGLARYIPMIIVVVSTFLLGYAMQDRRLQAPQIAG